MDDRTYDYRVESSVTVTFRINDSDALERVTGPNGDEWRKTAYPLHTVNDVLEHWTYNRLCNGIGDISQLDGWADIDPGAVMIDVEYDNVEYVVAS